MNIFAGDGVIHFIGKKEFGKFMNGIPVTGGPARPLSPPPPPLLLFVPLQNTITNSGGEFD